MISDRRMFLTQVQNQIVSSTVPPEWLFQVAQGPNLPSSVLFLLGPYSADRGASFRPCLILNKRSEQVLQPGDLCCPGGGLSPKTDNFLARLLALPGSPLTRWPHWQDWRLIWPDAAYNLRLLLAVSLRESFEEMRLNPLLITFLGPLPPHRLVMFQRTIFPMVGWIDRQRRFYPNWEVEKIIRVPIDALLTPAHYGLRRVGYTKNTGSAVTDYPCFTFRNGAETETLWGATYRIVMAFLKMVFGFTPPDPDGLPMVSVQMDRIYFDPSFRTRGR